MSTFRKTLIGSIASLAIGVAAFCSSSPASALFRPGGGGGFHGGGGGGWHGGGGGCMEAEVAGVMAAAGAAATDWG